MATLRQPPETSPAPALQVITGNANRRRLADRGIVHAKSQDGLLTWSYTTSLYLSFNHPEILVAGLDPFLAQSMITQLLEQISQGRVFAEGSSTDSALHQLLCAFRQMPSVAAARLMPSLGGRSALQLVYPDNRNRLPWQSDYNASWREVQPLFMIGAPLGEVECRFLEAAMNRPLLADRRSPVEPAPMAENSLE